MTPKPQFDEFAGWFNAFKFLLASPLLDDNAKRQVDIARAEWFKSVHQPPLSTNPATLLATDQLAEVSNGQA
jgi:hypothetical protein